MSRATAVIGANFGDEGKGRTVDALADHNTLVVRFNGGGQAGHTVEANGTRHVFSHFGAGTLAGAPTLLSRFFVCNPVIFVNEYQELQNKGFNPRLTVDPACPLTTPYEVAVNRALERSRGVSRHGSVGVGFGETIQREDSGITLCVANPIRTRLGLAREHAVRRLQELDLPVSCLIEADQQLSYWLYCLDLFRARSRVEIDHVLLRSSRKIIFEGAQGLLLDADSQFFPHVTRSKTGLANVKILCDDADIKGLRAIYVTRSYLTRHGAGPLPREAEGLRFEDKTNVHGEFQGSLRFGLLQPSLLKETILTDLALMPEAEGCIAMTCLDQMGGLLMAYATEETTGIPVSYTSHGPQREAFKERREVESCRGACFPRASVVCS